MAMVRREGYVVVSGRQGFPELLGAPQLAADIRVPFEMECWRAEAVRFRQMAVEFFPV